MDAKVQLTKVVPEGLIQLKVGDRIVHVGFDGSDTRLPDMYWATVKSVSSKRITVTVPDQSYKHREMTWAAKAYYSGGTVYLEHYGDAAYGHLALATSDEEIAYVQSSYDQRAADAAAETERLNEQERQRKEYARKHAEEAHAANPDVTFTEISVQGSVRHYMANILNSRNEMVFVVASVLRMKEMDWDAPKDANGNRQFSWIWKAAVNYSEPSNPEYGPRSMGSRSDVSGKTLEELFANIIDRIWG